MLRGSKIEAHGDLLGALMLLGSIFVKNTKIDNLGEEKSPKKVIEGGSVIPNKYIHNPQELRDPR